MSQFDHESDDQSAAANKLVREFGGVRRIKRIRGQKAKLTVTLTADGVVIWEGEVPIALWLTILKALPEEPEVEALKEFEG